MINSIVHICLDEKFINGIVVQFERYSHISSKFFILKKKNKPSYIKATPKNMVFFNSARELIKALQKESCDVVILHSLFLEYRYLKKISQPLILCTWGYDIYSDIYDFSKKRIQIDLFKPWTRKILDTIKRNKGVIYQAKQILKRLLGIHLYKNSLYNKSIKKAIAISTVLPCEFELLKLPSATYCPFQYTTLNKTDLPELNKTTHSTSSKTALVGNSLDPTNNHIDILKSLNDLGENIEVVLPINYAGSESYKNKLKESVSTLKNIKPIFLETFLEKSQYYTLTSSCQSAIFGHIRQQAMGNISHMISQGKKIFLYKDSIAFKYLKSCGYHIYSIEDDLKYNFVTEPLSNAEKKENNDLYKKLNDTDQYIARMIQFFSTFQGST